MHPILYKEDDPNGKSYELLSPSETPSVGYSDVSDILDEWVAAFMDGYGDPLRMRGGLMHHLGDDYPSMATEDKKKMVRMAAEPVDTLHSSLEALYPLVKRRKFSSKMFGFHTQVINLIEVSGSINVPLDKINNRIYIKPKANETTTVVWKKKQGLRGVLLLEQGLTGIIELPVFANSVSVTLSNIDGECDVLSFEVLDGEIHVSGFIKAGANL